MKVEFFGSINVQISDNYLIDNRRGEYCGPIIDGGKYYELKGGTTKRQILRFTKYIEVHKKDEYGFAEPIPYFFIVGCFFDTFYVVVFDFDEGNYVQLLKLKVDTNKTITMEEIEEKFKRLKK